MSQILSENDCGNRHFYKCVIKDAHCENCGKFFSEQLKKGDWIKHKCWSCRELKNIQVKYIWNKSQIEGRCKDCLAMDKAIGSLYEDFVYRVTEYEGDPDDHEEKLLNKIIKLPPAQLKEFLTRMNRGIER